ncbi:hypothetical protein Tco_1062210 [Tanacetum coccineum]
MLAMGQADGGQWERGTRKKKVEYDVLLLESRESWLLLMHKKEQRQGKGCNRHVAREEAQEREWQRKMNKINTIIRSLILHIPSDSSNTYGGGDAPDRPEEAGQLQVINWFCLVNIILNVLNGFGL